MGVAQDRKTAHRLTGTLGGILGFHVRLAHGAVNRHFAENFSGLGLTQKQVSALWLVDEFPGIAQTDLGGRLQMDRATTMTIASRLEEYGLLRRERSSDDRRKLSLFLTEEGVAALKRGKDAIGEHEKWLKSRLKPGEFEKLVEMLARIHE